jgi:L-threonylcarbamoyladenylate synthase
MPHSAIVLPTHTPALFDTAAERAAALLREGEVVALPTETVYGLAANALNEEAVQRIYEIKGRPAHNPIIVHVASIEMARLCATEWPDIADKLAASFWPGPLTIVLPRASQIPDVVAAGGKTVGIRWPSHPLMQAVIRKCGFPLAAPSANPANQVSPTNAEHVSKSLGGKVPLIVDGGQSQVGIESTVLDITVSPPRLLRPGMIHEESLIAVVGPLANDADTRVGALKSPGQLPKHYAPKAKLSVLSWNNDEDLQFQISNSRFQISKLHILCHSRIPGNLRGFQISVIPHDPEAYARAIYAELHRCDDAGAEVIVIEALPSGPEWNAIRDRLNRAAAE